MKTKALQMPFQVGWDIVHNCNLRCRHCYLTAEQLSDKTATPLGRALEFVREMVEGGVFHLSIAGGEPLLYDGLDEIIRAATCGGMMVAVSTNAMLLDEARAARLRDAGLNVLQVSLDGSRAEINDQIRGTGTFAAILRGLRVAVHAGFSVTLATVIVRQNVDDIKNIMRLADAEGVSSIKIQTFIDRGIGHQHATEVALDESALLAAVADLWEFKRTWHGRPQVMLPLTPEVVTLAREAPEYYYRQNSCLGCQPGISTVRVNNVGLVRACGALDDITAGTGSVFEASLGKIWRESQEFIRWRNEADVAAGRSATSCGSLCGKGCRSTTAPPFAKT